MEFRVLRLFAMPCCVQGCTATLVHRGCGVPSRCSGETNVVSTASWAPWKSGNPSNTTSILRLSNGFGAARSMCWTLTLADTRPRASLQTRAAADSNAKTLEPNTLATARWWPLESSGRPHRQERLDKGTRGTVAGRHAREGQRGNW